MTTADARYAELRARLAKADAAPTLPQEASDPDAYRPRPIWDVPTDHGIVTRHGATYAEAVAAAERCGLRVIQT